VNKLNLAEKVRAIAEKIVQNHSIELVHVEIVGSGKNPAVRIYIDKEEGVTHDDCALVSQGVEKILEDDDFIENAYTLEVSSPGIERGLYKLADFEKFKNNLAKVKTHTAINGQRNFRGKILDIKNQKVVFDDKTNGIIEIPYDLIKKANLEFDLEKELKQTKRRNF
jgi:ribosome maturation factor RimP